MSKRHPLDEIFKQNLRDASAPVPTDMWDRIAKTRRQRKRRRLVLVWSAVGATTIGLLALLLFPTTPPELGAFPLDQDGKTAGSTEQLPLATTLASESEAVVNVTSDEAAMPDRTANNIIATAIQPITATPHTDIVPVTPKVPTTTPTDVKTSTDSDKIIASTVASSATAETSKPDTEEEAPKIFGPHQRAQMAVIAQLPAKALRPAAQDNIQLFASHAPRCARFSNPFFRFDLEVLGGPAYAQQVLRAKTSESIEHLNQRAASETAGLSHSSGIRLAASSNVGLRLSSGLVYTQINDRFTFNVGSRMNVETIFGPNGEILRRDTTVVEGYQENHRNRLSFVEVPLLLGYEQRWGKLRVGVNAGAYLNVHFGARGTIYSPATQEPIEFGQQGETNVLPIFESRATAAWYAGFSMAYNLHSRYSLIAEPYFKSYPKPLSSSAYDLQQNYWMTGLQLGMRVRL